MKLVLVNNKDILLTEIHNGVLSADSSIVIDNAYVPANKLYLTYVSFNGSKFEKVEDLKITIPPSLFKEVTVIIKVRMIKKTDSSQIDFESDNLPIAKYVSFGPYIEKAYPKIISSMQRDIKELKRQVEVLETKGDIF